MSKLNKVIGENIRILRTASKMTQTELGKKLGVSHANISDIEHGKTKLSAENLCKLTKIFNFYTSDIFYYTPIRRDFRKDN